MPENVCSLNGGLIAKGEEFRSHHDSASTPTKVLVARSVVRNGRQWAIASAAVANTVPGTRHYYTELSSKWEPPRFTS
jgi:hypothetical protein